MKKLLIGLLVAAPVIAALAQPPPPPPRHHGDSGVALAAEIVGLVGDLSLIHI